MNSGSPRRKVMMLIDLSNPHGIKWVSETASWGNIELFCISLKQFNPEIYTHLTNVKTYSFGLTLDFMKGRKVRFKEIRYLLNFLKIRKIFKDFRPDILHVHYASSYGLLGALLFHPFSILNVWGADVYDFPQKSLFHKILIQWILSRYHIINSTSNCMKKVTANFTSKSINVTPFGVDLTIFKPNADKLKLRAERFNQADFFIGTIKSLEKKYGLNYLIAAAHLLINDVELKEISFHFLIVGEGAMKDELMNQIKSWNEEKFFTFTGFLSPSLIPEMHQILDIAIYPSILDSESFGVSVIESMACEVPVIVSDKGGLVEVVAQDETGFIVPAHNAQAIYLKMKELVQSESRRTAMGKAGRMHVLRHYNFVDNAQIIKKQYDHFPQIN